MNVRLAARHATDYRSVCDVFRAFSHVPGRYPSHVCIKPIVTIGNARVTKELKKQSMSAYAAQLSIALLRLKTRDVEGGARELPAHLRRVLPHPR